MKLKRRNHTLRVSFVWMSFFFFCWFAPRVLYCRRTYVFFLLSFSTLCFSFAIIVNVVVVTVAVIVICVWVIFFFGRCVFYAVKLQGIYIVVVHWDDENKMWNENVHDDILGFDWKLWLNENRDIKKSTIKFILPLDTSLKDILFFCKPYILDTRNHLFASSSQFIRWYEQIISSRIEDVEVNKMK